MKKTILSFLSCLAISVGFAQAPGQNKADKQYAKYAYIDATETYERIVEKGYKSPEVLSKLANSYYFNSRFDKAAKWYGELFALSSEVETEIYYRYAQSLKAQGNYAKSDDMMKAFTAKQQEDLRGKNFTEKPDYMAVIKANSGRYEIGDAGINTQYSDYGSHVHNGKLYFTSARDTGNFVKRVHKWSNQYFTNVWSAEVTADSVGTPVRLSRGINSRFHEATPVFTSDGNTMYFTRNNFNDGKKGKSKDRITYLKIYKATRVVKDSVESWENITELPFNSDEFQVAHPALSADEKWLFFASDMPGGFGQSDLYKVAINPDGSFGTPINLGKEINTEGKETFPFATNENELYFSSDGYPGLGGLDIYMSKINADGSFAEPINVGEPANSKADDFAYFIDTQTRKGFLTSNREGGNGLDDIYKFLETRKLICEQELSGVVTDKDTKEPIAGAKVTLFDDKFKKIAEVTSDEKGFYDFGKVECGKVYYVRGEKDGYETKEERIEIPATSGKTELPIELEKKVKPIPIGGDLAKTFGIKEIYFDFDKSNIRQDAAVELAKILDVLEQYPTMKIDIRSHTDARGSKAYNEKLSDRRAKSTREWLISKGISADRMTAKGYGENQPVNQCVDGVKCSEEDHQLNRRSEFIITGM